MTTPDVGTDDEAGVTIRCQDNASVCVTSCDRFSFDADSVHYAVELQAPGLTARCRLPRMGRRTKLAYPRPRPDSVAVFRSGGHVGLTWAVRPWPRAAGSWGASVTTWLEAGEQMTCLAADVRAFLAKEYQ
jgi:hypothetical protein